MSSGTITLNAVPENASVQVTVAGTAAAFDKPTTRSATQAATTRITSRVTLSTSSCTGLTDVSGEADSGVSFSIVSPLVSATASASVPATSCSYDANFNLIGCVDVTVAVSASWTGQGPIEKGTFNSNFPVDEFHVIEHFTGSSREATATATLDGTSFGAGDLAFADFGTAKHGTVTICNNC